MRYIDNKPLPTLVVFFNVREVISVAKSADAADKKQGNVKKFLGKRVEVTPKKGKLSRDVKMPKWLRAFGGYFKGSYQELRQVKWPTRKSTWGLTLAVILFTLFFVIIILALDYGFDQLFKQVI